MTSAMGMSHCHWGGPNRAAGSIRPRPGRNKKPAPAAPGTIIAGSRKFIRLLYIKHMALIQFVRNYDDLSTDRGYQFKFHCDKCGNGYMTQFQASTLGIAEALLNVASDFLSGWGRAGSAAHEVERV